MILFKPDKDRCVNIAGVPAPVPRPVDIDQARTGFTTLRTLRIYQVATNSVIEGHAEEDEVFIVILSGCVELTMFGDLSMLDTGNLPDSVTLAAPDDERSVCCAAYLGRGGAYKLSAKTDADVAYARATPSGSRGAGVFFSSVKAAAPGVSMLLEATEYAERLRLRLVHIDAGQQDAALMPVDESESRCETLVHVRTMPAGRGATISKAGAEPIVLDTWDTVAVSPGERSSVGIAMGSSLLALIVFAVE